jgi:TonB family protein
MARTWSWLTFLAACGGVSAEGPTTTRHPDGSLTVPIRILERQMLSGVREPRLPDDVQEDFRSLAVTDPRMRVELCLDPDGRPTTVEVRESSRHELADQIVTDAVRGWRFSPTLGDDGRPVRVCTVVTFRWRISFPPERRPSSFPG